MVGFLNVHTVQTRALDLDSDAAMSTQYLPRQVPRSSGEFNFKRARVDKNGLSYDKGENV